MVMRLTGSGSGLNIDQMVYDLMRAERVPQEKLKQKQQALTWKADQYREINTKMANFRDAVNDLRFTGGWNAASTKASSSDTSKVTVSSNGSSALTDHTIVINSLASNAKIASQSSITTTSGDRPIGSTTLADIGITGDGSFSINGTTVNYSPTDTLDVLRNNVSRSGAGVTMTLIGDKISFASKASGASAQVTLADGTGGTDDTLLAKFNFGSNPAPVFGSDADVMIDDVQTTFPSNQFVVDGVSYTALAPTDPAGISVGVTRDMEAMVNKVTDFVKTYNELVSLMSTRVTEQNYRDFQPLAQEEKDAMSEKDVETWETKAKSGLLNGDTMIRNMMSTFRAATGSEFAITSDADFTLLSQIGISTKSIGAAYDAKTVNNLVVDTTKLKEALATDPDGVVQMFAGQGTDNQRGIAQMLYESSNDFVTQLTAKAGREGSVYDDRTKTVGNEIFAVSRQISDWERRLEDKENSYYKQFTAMDSAVGKGNSQMDWLSKQF